MGTVFSPRASLRDATAARKQHILSVKGTTVQPTVRSQLHTLHAHPGGGHFLSANKLWCYPLHVFFFSYRKLNVSTAPTLLFFKPPVASQLYRVDAYNWSIACLTKNSFQPNATHPQVFTMERSSNLVWIKCLLLLKVRFLDTQPPLPPQRTKQSEATPVRVHTCFRGLHLIFLAAREKYGRHSEGRKAQVHSCLIDMC